MHILRNRENVTTPGTTAPSHPEVKKIAPRTTRPGRPDFADLILLGTTALLAIGFLALLALLIF